ncbi:hypothetical protein [Paenarthrobacter sp. JL.01a]|uniref:hypothetical protein n=1 Tax=Paenarthrobacter sp. JL.01a TaxID=2979324 RepID=UPI0021C8C68B|nr:hypothetical protein [Paenarthrobacter sp. JL.01a]UXM93340.1 hypothetical protein N5P29_08550 [Paenarthrobacter sp. JL.01a]
MKESSSQTAGLIVNAVVSVANVTDVINGASVISVNLSHLLTGHNKSRQGRLLKAFIAAGIGGSGRVRIGPLDARLGEGRGGVATLIRE